MFSNWFGSLCRSVKSSSSRRRRSRRLCLEALEDRLVPSGTATSAHDSPNIQAVSKTSLTPARPLILVPDLGGSFATDGAIGQWMTQIGLPPQDLQIDPLSNAYGNLIATLEKAGYVEGQNFFVANWDWRLPLAPNSSPTQPLSGVTAASITAGTYDYALDYLGTALETASQAWNKLHKGAPADVDVLGYGAGGLIARAYIESAAYHGQYAAGHDLPSVQNLVMVGVPNQGEIGAWNMINNNWDSNYDRGLAELVDLGYQGLADGGTVTSPDGKIDPSSALFVKQYVGALADLLPNYTFFAGQQGVLKDSNFLPSLDGTDFKSLRIDGTLTEIYSRSVATADADVLHSHGAGSVYPFTSPAGQSASGQTWFTERTRPANGDGTVLASSAIFKPTSGRIVLRQVGSAAHPVTHAGLIDDPAALADMLAALGHASKQVSTGHQYSGTQLVAPLLKTAVLADLEDPPTATLSGGFLAQELNNVRQYLPNPKAANTSFTPFTITIPSLQLGNSLQIDNATLRFQGLSYAPKTGFSGDVTITSDQATLSVGQGLSASLTDGTGTGGTTLPALSGTLNLATGMFDFTVGQAAITVPGLLTGTATNFQLSFNPNSTGRQPLATVPTLNATLAPLNNLPVTFQGMQIYSDGFLLPDDTISVGNVSLTSIFQFNNLALKLTGFSYSSTQGFQGSIGVVAGSADMNFGPLTASATGISGTVDLVAPTQVGSVTPDGLAFSVGSLNIQLGSWLAFQGSNIAFDTKPANGADMADFGSLSATLQIPGVMIHGTASNFGIGFDGLPILKPGFQVSLETDIGPDALQWPSWLPMIQISTLSLQWPNFAADPLNFTLDVSATISRGIPFVAPTGDTMSGFQVEGSIQGMVVDVGLLEQGKFPITNIGSVTAIVNGSLFGADLSGGFVIGIAQVNNQPVIYNGRPVLYGGIEGSIQIGGFSFGLMLGLSQLGPLDGLIELGAPVLLAPLPLELSELVGGIEFDQSLPSISDPRQLQTETAFNPTIPGQVSVTEWQNQLAEQVVNQVESQSAPAWTSNPFNAPAVFVGGATVLVAGVPSELYSAQGMLLLGTDGKFMLDGTELIAGLPVQAKLFVDLSQVASGQAAVLADVTVPQPVFGGNLADLYGSLTVNSSPTNLTITMTGGFNINSLAGLDVSGTGQEVLVSTPATSNTPAQLDITLNGQLSLDPIGNLINVAGHFDVQQDSSGTPEIWGALVLDTAQLDSLQKLGIDINGEAAILVNSTGLFGTQPANENITVQVPQGSGATQAETFSLPAGAASLYVNGSAAFEQDNTAWFSIQGTLDAAFVVTGTTYVDLSDSLGTPILGVDGQPIQVPVYTFTLDVLAAGTLIVGPASSPALALGINGFLQISDTPGNAGVAGLIDATYDNSNLPGLSLNATLFVELNTTSQDITYTVPAGFPIPAEDPSGTVSIPAGPVDPSGNEGPAGPYLVINGSGDVTVGQQFDLKGKFDLLVSNTGLTANFNSSLNLSALGSANATGSLDINSAGVCGILTLAATSPLNGRDFSLNGYFELEINTTAVPQTALGFTVDHTSGNVTANQQVVIPAGTAAVVVGGDLSLIDSFDITGEFDLTANQGGFAVDLNGTVNILGTQLTVSGGAVVAAGGVALSIDLGDQIYTFPAVQIQADSVLEINSFWQNMTVDGTTVPADTIQVALNSVNVNIAQLFTLNGSLDITLSNGDFDVSGSLNMNLLNIIPVTFNCDIQDNNGAITYTLTGSASVSTSGGFSGSFAGTGWSVSWYASLGGTFTISNTGSDLLSASVSGSAGGSLSYGLVSASLNISAGGSVTIDNSGAIIVSGNVNLGTILGIPLGDPSFSITIGTLTPVEQTQVPPQITAVSAPKTGTVGTPIDIVVIATDPNSPPSNVLIAQLQATASALEAEIALLSGLFGTETTIANLESELENIQNEITQLETQGEFSYAWTVTELNSTNPTGKVAGNANGNMFAFTPQTAGTYRVEVTVSKPGGQSVTEVFTIQVN